MYIYLSILMYTYILTIYTKSDHIHRTPHTPDGGSTPSTPTYYSLNQRFKNWNQSNSMNTTVSPSSSRSCSSSCSSSSYSTSSVDYSYFHPSFDHHNNNDRRCSLQVMHPHRSCPNKHKASMSLDQQQQQHQYLKRKSSVSWSTISSTKEEESNKKLDHQSSSDKKKRHRIIQLFKSIAAGVSSV
jgi:hypothetical protein